MGGVKSAEVLQNPTPRWDEAHPGSVPDSPVAFSPSPCAKRVCKIGE